MAWLRVNATDVIVIKTPSSSPSALEGTRNDQSPWSFRHRLPSPSSLLKTSCTLDSSALGLRERERQTDREDTCDLIHTGDIRYLKTWPQDGVNFSSSPQNYIRGWATATSFSITPFMSLLGRRHSHLPAPRWLCLHQLSQVPVLGLAGELRPGSGQGRLSLHSWVCLGREEVRIPAHHFQVCLGAIWNHLENSQPWVYIPIAKKVRQVADLLST